MNAYCNGRTGGRLLVALLIVATVSGCTTVTRAKDVVVSKTQAAVDVVKRTATSVMPSKPSAENSPVPPTAGEDATSSAAKVRPDPGTDELEVTGMLSVVRPKDCLASKGCKPFYRLYNQNFSVRTALSGDVHEVHDGMLVTLKGRWIPLSGPELKGGSWQRTDSAIEVANYDVVSGHRYRDFLVNRAEDFAKQTYGCGSAWDRSFGWQVVNREPYLIVRMTNPLNRTNPEHVELWYHGKSGKFLRESKSHANVNPCR